MRSVSYREILRLVWPLALGMANNAIMQFTDRVFLARESTASLEAVLPASILAILFIGFFQSVVAYSGTFVAQYHGAGDPEGCSRSCRAGLMLSLASGLFLALFIPLGRLICDWSGHSPDVLLREKTYYTIVMSGSFFLCAAMAVQSFFTGIGRTRIVFWVNVLGNAANILLDYLLIFGCGPIPASGIAGAAVATVAAQALQFIVLLVLARPHLSFRTTHQALSTKHQAPSTKHLLTRIIRFGSPAGIYSVLNILSFAIFVFLTGRVGDMAFAVSNSVFTVNYLLYAPIEGFAVGVGTLVGQCQGAGDPDGAAQACHRTLLLAELVRTRVLQADPQPVHVGRRHVRPGRFHVAGVRAVRADGRVAVLRLRRRGLLRRAQGRRGHTLRHALDAVRRVRILAAAPLPRVLEVADHARALVDDDRLRRADMPRHRMALAPRSLALHPPHMSLWRRRQKTPSPR